MESRVDAGLSPADVLLWIETSGLRGVRTQGRFKVPVIM